MPKKGQIVDYVNLIDRFIKPNTIFAIDDDYRYKYIVPGRKPSKRGFGSETYYGQDFVYKTANGRTLDILIDPIVAIANFKSASVLFILPILSRRARFWIFQKSIVGY